MHLVALSTGVLPGHVIRGRRNPLHLSLPKRLKKARLEAGLDQKALSVSAGMSHGTVFHIERGLRVPGIDTVEKLADALRRSPSSLAYAEQHAHAPSSTPRHQGMPGRLRQAREFRHLSLNMLGGQSGTSHVTVKHIEEGDSVPLLDTVEKLAKALQVPPGWLAYGEGPDPLQAQGPDTDMNSSPSSTPGGPGGSGAGTAPAATISLWRRALGWVQQFAGLAK